MTERIKCRRCEREAPRMDESPLPGTRWEQELLDHTCAACFSDWMATEIMLMNEYQLDMSNPHHFEQLNNEMAKWLNLPSAPAGEVAGAPPHATPQD
jgi:Fe-S cluster biosynthesis and repair protein YggX